MKIRNLIIFGTRPEAIKMAPLVKMFHEHNDTFDTKVCITAQHREMLDQVLEFFKIQPDFDMNLMRPGQNLFSLTGDIISGLKEILEVFKPEYVFVHGDTTTTMAASIAAFYYGAKVCHIEAGLRTFDKGAPFPEEMNRSIVGRIAEFHFAPTISAKNNLLKENVPEDQILVTGNTVIDALEMSVTKLRSSHFKDDEIEKLKSLIKPNKKIVLVTGHRRENHGQGFIDICNALVDLGRENENIQIVYPVHLNPNVQKPVYEILRNFDNIYLIPPLSYPSFVWLMDRSHLIITDSGGVQEEAPSLGKPVLVMRETTERPEAVEAGTVILTGTDRVKIFKEAHLLLNDENSYNEMSLRHNPYGDGQACSRIVMFMKAQTKQK